MASSFAFLDDLIRDYFNYRGLTSTLRTFDNEVSKIPIGQFRADRLTEQLLLYINQYDIQSLIDTWTQIEQRLLAAFSIRSGQQTSNLSKIRTNLYRCYLVHCIQSSKTEKIQEFFDKLAKQLQQSNEWTKEWFALPFIKNPEENSTFQLYFSKQWNDLFWISLQNFLATAFYHMIPPKICSLEDNNSQQFGNLISQQTSNSRFFLPPSARIDPSMNQFAEVLDEIQISPGVPGSEPQRQSSLTIMSKFRNNFLPNARQSTSRTKRLPTFSKLVFAQPTAESSTGNQITVSTDEPLVKSSPSSTITSPRPRGATVIQDEAHIEINEEKLVRLADFKHHSSTITDCKLNANGTLYSTLDIQNNVRIWSANEDFELLTSLASRSAALQCQTFDPREALLYLGTSVSTIKVLHITEKRIVNETVIDKYYPRIMSMCPQKNQNRLVVSLASASRSNSSDNSHVRSGRVSILDTNTWTTERVLSDHDENFVTCINVHSDRQLMVFGFSDGKICLYDTRSNTLIHQKQQHSRLVQDIRCFDDYLYTIGNDNLIIQSNLSSLEQFIQSYELPYCAVGPYQISSESMTPSPTLLGPRRSGTLNIVTNQFFPIGNVFDIDPYEPDRLITCSPMNPRFYRLSTAEEDAKLSYPMLGNPETNFSTSCVHWNREKDFCLSGSTNGVIQLFRRVNKPEM